MIKLPNQELEDKSAQPAVSIGMKRTADGMTKRTADGMNKRPRTELKDNLFTHRGFVQRVRALWIMFNDDKVVTSVKNILI